MQVDLLLQRLVESKALLAQVRGAAELAQTISQHAGSPLVLEDHPWLRAAAPHFPHKPAREIYFIAGPGNPTPEAVDTLVSIGLGAVPETGSVLLGGHSPQGFRMSLCPRCHLVVIPVDRAFLTMSAALALTAQEPSALVSWITGPSRTADIEKVLVLGAQGAAELVVIVYQEGEPEPGNISNS